MKKYLLTLLFSSLSLFAQSTTVNVKKTDGTLFTGTLDANVYPNITQFATDEQDISGRYPQQGRFLISLTEPVSGFWVWDATSTATPGEGVIDVSGYLVGRWIRQFGSTTAPTLSASRGVVFDANKRAVASTATKQQVDNTAMQVATVAAMRALDPAQLNNGQLIQTGGRNTAGDGGGSTFRYVAGDTTTTNLGTVFSFTSGTGRVIWIGVGDLTAEMFGAIPNDGLGDSTAINAGLTYLNGIPGGGLLNAGAGQFDIDETITIPIRTRLIGASDIAYWTGQSIVSTNATYRILGATQFRRASNLVNSMIAFSTNGGPNFHNGNIIEDGSTNYTFASVSSLSRVVLDGNQDNTSGAPLIYAKNSWSIEVKDVGVVNWKSGHLAYFRDCNVVRIFRMLGGSDVGGKGIVFDHTADGEMHDCQLGGIVGPVLFVNQAGGQKNIIVGNLLFNSIGDTRNTVTGMASNTLTTTTNHVFNVGDPIIFETGGGTLPSPLATNIVAYAAVVTPNTIQVHTNRDLAVAGQFLALSGGSGVYYVTPGTSSGLYIMRGQQNTVVGNRFDQHFSHGVVLNEASNNSIVGNSISENGFNTTNLAAGVFIMGNSSDNVVLGNNGRTQDYGVYADSTTVNNLIQARGWASSVTSALVDLGSNLQDLDTRTTTTVPATWTLTGAPTFQKSDNSTLLKLERTGGSAGNVTANVGNGFLELKMNAGINAISVQGPNATQGRLDVRPLAKSSGTGGDSAYITTQNWLNTQISLLALTTSSGSDVLQIGRGGGFPGPTSIEFLTTATAGTGTGVVRGGILSSGKWYLGPGAVATSFAWRRNGTVALVGGTATVSDANVTANTRILLTSQSDGGTPGWLRVSARSAGVSFTITSSSATDTSTVGYEMIEP